MVSVVASGYGIADLQFIVLSGELQLKNALHEAYMISCHMEVYHMLLKSNYKLRGAKSIDGIDFWVPILVAKVPYRLHI